MPPVPPPPPPPPAASIVAVDPTGFLVREAGGDGAGSAAPLRFATLAEARSAFSERVHTRRAPGFPGQEGWRPRLEIEVPDPADPGAPPALLPWIEAGGAGRTGAPAGGPAEGQMAASPGVLLVRADLGPAWCWDAEGCATLATELAPGNEAVAAIDDEMESWALDYDGAVSWESQGRGPVETWIDWASFDARGLRLAARLKEQVAGGAIVLYAWANPNLPEGRKDVAVLMPAGR